jgi:hypothetical protein
VAIIAKAAMHRRAMMESGWSATGGHPYGHRGFGGPDGEMGPRAYRLPPRIEAALGAWHARAHAASDATKPEPSQDEA